MNKDWHVADIIAAIRKQGTSMAAISRSVGLSLSSSTLANVLTRPRPKGECLIADALSIHPAEIWPNRHYDEAGGLIDRKIKMRKAYRSKVTIYFLD